VLLLVCLSLFAAAVVQAQALTFASRAAYRTGSQARAIAVGDVNADGKLDVLQTSEGAGVMCVLLQRWRAVRAGAPRPTGRRRCGT